MIDRRKGGNGDSNLEEGGRVKSSINHLLGEKCEWCGGGGGGGGGGFRKSLLCGTETQINAKPGEARGSL